MRGVSPDSSLKAERWPPFIHSRRTYLGSSHCCQVPRWRLRGQRRIKPGLHPREDHSLEQVNDESHTVTPQHGTGEGCPFSSISRGKKSATIGNPQRKTGKSHAVHSRAGSRQLSFSSVSFEASRACDPPRGAASSKALRPAPAPPEMLAPS